MVEGHEDIYNKLLKNTSCKINVLYDPFVERYLLFCLVGNFYVNTWKQTKKNILSNSSIFPPFA